MQKNYACNIRYVQYFPDLWKTGQVTPQIIFCCKLFYEHHISTVQIQMTLSDFEW